MAETQRVASSSASSRPAPKPRLRHPPRRPPLRPGLDETHDLRPPRTARQPATPTAVATTPPVQEARPAAPVLLRRLPPRSPAEWVILAVLLFGLGLNVAALLAGSHLSRSDLLLGATVLFAGFVLLILIELCRRSAPPLADEPD
ncbi:MAG TPA: hypothetical protein VLX28_25930 [Thermoanaerobaculia bacterium]|nr:hypothetical protein [Thermoanaerobaculia bacterium]